VNALHAVRSAVAAGGLAVVALGAAAAAAAADSSPTPSSSPSPSQSASATPSPSPSKLPLAEGGHWDINGAVLTMVGALAGQLEAGGNTVKVAGSATKDAWNFAFSAEGGGPVSVSGTVTGPGPVIDVTTDAFGVPIRVHGTPGSDLGVDFGRSAKSLSQDVVLTAAVSPMPLAADPGQAIASAAEDWLRGFVAFGILGLLLILVVPGLKTRAREVNPLHPFTRIGLGLILLLDVPLAALAIIALGVPTGLWWLGLVLLLAFLVLTALGFAYAGVVIGRHLFDRLGFPAMTWLAAVPLGVAVVVLISVLPYVGALLALLLVSYGMGAMLLPTSTAAPEAAALPAPQPAPEPQAQLEGRGTRPVVE
jgi:hypothetical protein